MSTFPVEGLPLLDAYDHLLWDLLPAQQQPDWRDHPYYATVRRALLGSAPLTTFAEVAQLKAELAEVAAGEARLLQIGDCAESLNECTPAHVATKLSVLDTLGDVVAARGGLPVVRAGRLGGQFAKPRSAPTERHGDVEIPAFRGHIVNSEAPTAEDREHDPRRMLLAYRASAGVVEQLRERRPHAGRGPWASHEALLVDYEGPLVRTDEATGTEYLASTHLPWIGERTRQADSAHVEMLSAIGNPVACKVGPTATAEEVLRLCAALDPEREPGRLTLILRFGRDQIAAAMPGIVEAVRGAGHPVVWVTDPMHGNTVKTEGGVKTRHLRTIAAEVDDFLRILDRLGEHAGGLHLETAATGVTECLGGRLTDEDQLDLRYETLCDPRLNPEQAHELLSSITF